MLFCVLGARLYILGASLPCKIYLNIVVFQSKSHSIRLPYVQKGMLFLPFSRNKK